MKDKYCHTIIKEIKINLILRKSISQANGKLKFIRNSQRKGNKKVGFHENFALTSCFKTHWFQATQPYIA